LSHKSLAEVTAKANTDLEQLDVWFKANRMSLNTGKTYYMHFTLIGKKSITLKIAGTTIKEKESLKFLGMHIDTLLNWNQHIDHVRNKLRSALYAINRMKHYIPSSYMRTLYFTMIQCHIDYGLILYGNANQSNLKKIQTTQNKAIRTISNSINNSSTTSQYKALKILKIREQYELIVGKFMYRFKIRTLPVVLQCMFQQHREVHNYDTRNKDNPFTPYHRLDKTNKSLLNMGPKIWHNVPIDIKHATSVNSFKFHMKHQLLKRY
jgi:hypothetical protein